jgi:hypothetical protein
MATRSLGGPGGTREGVAVAVEGGAKNHIEGTGTNASRHSLGRTRSLGGGDVPPVFQPARGREDRNR